MVRPPASSSMNGDAMHANLHSAPDSRVRETALRRPESAGHATGMRPEVLDYYLEDGERVRLREGLGRLEFWRTQDVLRRVLPAPPARVLDVGGGDGVHAQWLAA